MRHLTLVVLSILLGMSAVPLIWAIPPDQVVESNTPAEIREYRAAIAPYLEQARKTYPDAKKRYLKGLPKGHRFFAVTQLRDRKGVEEQAFVLVTAIRDGRVNGRIANDIVYVSGYKDGDPYSFPESNLVDWLIVRPDGTEEGNVVGKFLDEWQKTRNSK